MGSRKAAKPPRGCVAAGWSLAGAGLAAAQSGVRSGSLGGDGLAQSRQAAKGLCGGGVVARRGWAGCRSEWCQIRFALGVMGSRKPPSRQGGGGDGVAARRGSAGWPRGEGPRAALHLAASAHPAARSLSASLRLCERKSSCRAALVRAPGGEPPSRGPSAPLRLGGLARAKLQLPSCARPIPRRRASIARPAPSLRLCVSAREKSSCRAALVRAPGGEPPSRGPTAPLRLCGLARAKNAAAEPRSSEPPAASLHRAARPSLCGLAAWREQNCTCRAALVRAPGGEPPSRGPLPLCVSASLREKKRQLPSRARPSPPAESLHRVAPPSLCGLRLGESKNSKLPTRVRSSPRAAWRAPLPNGAIRRTTPRTKGPARLEMGP